MPSLIDLRRRIRAVRNTQQITKAMKTVSASKLRRAQDRILGARPYARELRRVLSGLASRVDAAGHALLAAPAPQAARTSLLVVVTADKGLCGGFNAAVIRRVGAYLDEASGPVALALLGRKGRDFFRRHAVEVRYEDSQFFHDLQYIHAQGVAEAVIGQFTAGAVTHVDLVYNRFKNVMQQEIMVDRLLPIPRVEPEEDATERLPEYLFEPHPERIFDTLLPRYVEMQVFRALLESVAAEHAARMTAMDSATRNAGTMIESLTLHMNKVRQATITRELIEVVSGAEAL